MKLDALIFVLVQVLTTNFQRHLFYIIFTEKASTMLAFFLYIYFTEFARLMQSTLNEKRTAADLQQPFYYLSIPQGNDFSTNALSFLTAS